MTSGKTIQTVLIIEDDRHIRDSIREILEAEGFNVLTAENGKSGLEKMRLLPKPVLVLLDFLMPVMGGREFLDIAMNDAILAPIPVVIVSSMDGREDTSGSRKVLKKPVDMDLLLNVVRHYTRNI